MIDQHGVYFGGRPGRRIDWSEIRRVAAFVGDRHDEAPSEFWSGTGLTYECCFEFWPHRHPGTTPGRHQVERTWRREFESWHEIASVRTAVLRHGSDKVARDVHPKATGQRE